MGAYDARFAELYDLFYADKPYAEETAFVSACLSSHGKTTGKRVLELACGTGRHALELEKLGWDVVGTDLSEAMLAAARTRAAAAGARARFVASDMRAIDASLGSFDAAVCLFDAIGYVITNEALDAVLAGLRRVLSPGGAFVFEVWHAAAMLRGFDPVRVRRFRDGACEIVRVSETAIDVAAEVARVVFTVYEHRDDGTFSTFREEHVNRFFLVQEVAAWLARGGFEPVAFHDGFSLEGTVGMHTWHVVGVARRMG